MFFGKLKSIPTDFIVMESMVLLPSIDDGKYHYYVLEKCNYTTFEAISIVAAFFSIQQQCIGYAGLKDEDGVTKQFISIPSDCKLSNSTNEFNEHYFLANSSKFIRLCYYGNGSTKINIGELSGNNFRIIVRKINKQLADKLFSAKKIASFFINYYGSQRFGLPNAEKNTHLIGENLLDKNYEAALKYLRTQPNEIGTKATMHAGSAEDFFGEIDGSLLAFYQSSYYSAQWNAVLDRKIKKQFASRVLKYAEDGISFSFLIGSKTKLELLSNGIEMDLPYTRVVLVDNKFVSLSLNRHTVIQTCLMCNNIFPDDIYSGYWAVDISFFLPTGCYATMAIPQLMIDIDN